MTLDALRAFSVFAGYLNFTHAAEELHISQPALHVKIRKLGASLETELYTRDGRGLVLTPSGASLVHFARSYLHELQGFVATLKDAPRPPLVLAAGEGAHRYVVRSGVQRLVARNYALRLLTTDREHTIDAVRTGRAHVGVTVLDTAPRGLEILTLATYPQVALMRSDHDLARARSLELRNLASVEIVTAPEGRPQRRALERAAQLQDVSLTIVAEAEGWAQMMDFVELGVGVAIVNGCVTPAEGLVARIVNDLPAITYSALTRRGDEMREEVTNLLSAIQGGVP